jgi:UDP-glucose 4-epimerase
VSKVAAEQYLEVWASLAGGRATVLRLANVYGRRQSPHGEAGVVAIFAHRLLQGEPCVINGDGEQTRDYVCVDDVAEAVALALAQNEVVGVFNVATGTETSVNELYRRLARLAGVDRPPVHGPSRPGEQRRSVLDADRAKAVLGWTPTVGLDEGLARTLAHVRGRR